MRRRRNFSPTPLALGCIAGGIGVLAAMNILVLPGDGIGPEIASTATDVLAAADRAFSLGLRLTRTEIGLVTLRREGTTLPRAVMAASRAAAGIVLGPVSHNIYPPRDEGGINASSELRIALDLYANIRPSRSRPGIGDAHGAMDLVIVRDRLHRHDPSLFHSRFGLKRERQSFDVNKELRGRVFSCMSFMGVVPSMSDRLRRSAMRKTEGPSELTRIARKGYLKRAAAPDYSSRCHPPPPSTCISSVFSRAAHAQTEEHRQ
jgi:hypothetical protein